jgi:hypothetical protein
MGLSIAGRTNGQRLLAAKQRSRSVAGKSPPSLCAGPPAHAWPSQPGAEAAAELSVDLCQHYRRNQAFRRALEQNALELSPRI